MDEAIALLEAHARAGGEHTTRERERDEAGCGSTVYVRSPTWTCRFSEDTDEVWDHVGMRRNHPAGQAASVAWVRERIAACGLPDRVVVLPLRHGWAVEAVLEWSDVAARVEVTLQIRDGAWDVRADLHGYPSTRGRLVEIHTHRERLAALREHLAHQPAASRSARALVDTISRWVRERDEVLAALEPLIPGVGMLDVGDAIADVTRILDLLAAEPSPGDGAFLVVRRPLPSRLQEMRRNLFQRTGAVGPRSVTLTHDTGPIVEPTIREPLPAPPDEYVEWVEGPLGARFLRDALRTVDLEDTCEVIPAVFVTVDGAVEERPRVPPPPDPQHDLIQHLFVAKLLHPLRLSHPPSGVSVYLNFGESEAEVRRYAHALLAARIASRA